MFTPSDRLLAILNRLNATYRFVGVGNTYEHDGKNQKIVSGGHTRCEIIDLTMNVVYASATGEDESHALDKAIQEAIKADKPMTPAQAFASNTATMTSKITDKDAEIASLRAQLDAANTAAAKPKGGKGKKKDTAEPGVSSDAPDEL